MSLAIPGISYGERARAAHVGAWPVPPYLDPRTAGLAAPAASANVPAGNDATAISDGIRDRITLTSRVRQPAQADRASQRRRTAAQPTTRNAASQSLSDMADSVSDRVTFSRAKGVRPPLRQSYSRYGAPAAPIPDEFSPELAAMASGVADQVTLAADPADGGDSSASDLTVYIAAPLPA
jgi:hypothetical protein